MKKIFIAVILCCISFMSSIAQASGQYADEINLEVGTAWRLQVPRVLYQADNHDVCELLDNEDGTYSILLTKPGDVVVTAYIFEDKQIYQAKYLIHITDKADATIDLPKGAAAYDEKYLAEEVLRLVNIERAKDGAKPLRLANDLQQGAKVRAEELTRRFSHDRPDGRKCFTVLRQIGSTAGENIAAGSATPAEVVQQWLDSPGHRANILRKGYKELGVGYCYDDNGVGGYKHYWVQIFRE